MNTIEAETGMAGEFREAPEAVRRQAETLAEPLRGLVHRLRDRPPQVVVTCARGSSAHAATFGKHLIERRFGIPVAAAAPNIATRLPSVAEALRPAISGDFAVRAKRRPDRDGIAARSAGALTVAMVQRKRKPARRDVRIRAADRRRAGAQHCGHQDLRRVARGTAAADGGVAGDPALNAAIGADAGPARGGRERSTGVRRSDLLAPRTAS